MWAWQTRPALVCGRPAGARQPKTTFAAPRVVWRRLDFTANQLGYRRRRRRRQPAKRRLILDNKRAILALFLSSSLSSSLLLSLLLPPCLSI
jgi:hypothetical protein